MPFLDERTRDQARNRLADLASPVRLVFFERALGCETCPEARSVAQEVAGLSDKITFEAYNVVTDREKAREFRVEDAPVLVVAGRKDHGIRFYGAPTGYEFGALLETIRDVSEQIPKLEAATLEALGGVNTPVHLRVFVTPT